MNDHTTPTRRAGLRDEIAAAARTVQLRLGPNAVAMTQRGEPIILNMREADDLADAVLPVLYREWPWLRAEAEDAAPADQTALRDRIAAVLAADDGWVWVDGFDKTRSPAYRGYLRLADKLLAVLPAPVDRAAVLREAADQYAKLTDQNEAYDREHGELDEEARLRHEVVRDVVAGLRRMADETAATETNTLPAWLHWRFGPHGQPWAEVPDEDKALWEYQARAVRRAVARGGFKQRAAGARQDGAQP